MDSSVGFLFLCVLALSALSQLQCRASLVSGGSDTQPAPLRIASFNVQVFGITKMKKQLVRRVLIKIIQRYDIILIQEIRSTTDTAIKTLLRLVNQAAAPREYGMVLSARLGRSSSKEQYAFLYRKDRVSVTDKYLFDDVAKGDKFEREPFVVRFNSPTSYVKDFAIGGIHVSPGKAPSEISDLVDVYDDIILRWKLSDVIFMGDFNAGCSYVAKSKWKTIKLATDRRFYWAFTDDQDTTVAKSDCPYDRMVMAGENMVKAVLPSTAKAFRFDIAYDLDQKESELVSDHYPIEIELKDSSYKDEELYIRKGFEFVTKDVRNKAINKREMYALSSRDNSLLNEGYHATKAYTKSGAIETISLGKATSDTDEALSAIHTLRRHFPKLISSTQALSAGRSLKRIFGSQMLECSSSDEEDWEYQVVPSPPSPLAALSVKMVKIFCSTKNSECLLVFQSV